MKRSITVRIDIDDEEEGTSVVNGVGLGTDTYDVIIRRLPIQEFTSTRFQILASLTHELGHLVGHLFDLPAARRDPRSLTPGQFLVANLDYGQATINSEIEAWDQAELMLSFATTRRECLSTYEKEFRYKFIPRFTEVKT